MQRTLTTTLLAGLLAAAGAVQAGQAGQTGSDLMANGKSVHGSAVVAQAGAKVVNIDDRKALNVDCGEIVTFRKGDKSFSWKFESANHRAVDLRAIAPSGFTDKPFMVYVSRNESERT